MANLDAPSGFKAVQNRGTSGYTGKTETVAFVDTDATAAFQGSMVEYTGNQIQVDGANVPVVTLAAPGATQLAGAILNFGYQTSNWDVRNRPANTEMLATIPADRDCEYEVQEDSDGSSIDPSVNTGNNVDFTAEVGNTQTGVSTQELDSSTAANTDTLPLRLVKYVSRADNDVSSDNAKWIVTINQDAYINTTGVN